MKYGFLKKKKKKPTRTNALQSHHLKRKEIRDATILHYMAVSVRFNP